MYPLCKQHMTHRQERLLSENKKPSFLLTTILEATGCQLYMRLVYLLPKVLLLCSSWSLTTLIH